MLVIQVSAFYAGSLRMEMDKKTRQRYVYLLFIGVISFMIVLLVPYYISLRRQIGQWKRKSVVRQRTHEWGQPIVMVKQ